MEIPVVCHHNGKLLPFSMLFNAQNIFHQCIKNKIQELAAVTLLTVDFQSDFGPKKPMQSFICSAIGTAMPYDSI